MKKLVLFLCAALISVSAVCNSHDSNQDSDKKKKRSIVRVKSKDTNDDKNAGGTSVGQKALMVFDNTTVDMGKIEYGKKAEAIFKFKNKGNLPLVILSCRADCGCTTPKWTKAPVKPGEEGEISVVYNSEITGPFNKNIVITSNTDGAMTQTVTIKGLVERVSNTSQNKDK